jgi:hypothetical protein
VQYGSALALNSTFWFWTVDRWMYEFATQLFNAKAFPLVVSMSWGWPEPDQCQIVDCSNGQTSFSYVNKVNVEFVKLGLKGITLLAASGDQGAPVRTLPASVPSPTSSLHFGKGNSFEMKESIAVVDLYFIS